MTTPDLPAPATIVSSAALARQWASVYPVWLTLFAAFNVRSFTSGSRPTWTVVDCLVLAVPAGLAIAVQAAVASRARLRSRLRAQLLGALAGVATYQACWAMVPGSTLRLNCAGLLFSMIMSLLSMWCLKAFDAPSESEGRRMVRAAARAGFAAFAMLAGTFGILLMFG